MPGDLRKTTPNRYIKSDLKSHKLVFEDEHPIRWSYMKILREFSTLKEFYPEIDPYAEAYKMRDNVWAIFSESMDGAGDPWIYVVDGPEKIMVVDTGFGVGNLRGLVEKLAGTEKPIIVCNTHHHFDHCYGNSQFEIAYCHEDEVYSINQTRNPHIWDYLFDENGVPIYNNFDPADLVKYHEYELVGLPSNAIIDLGGGYEVEVIPLRGHSPGMCGFLDKHNHILFAGDLTAIMGHVKPGEPKPENCTVERLRDDFAAICARLDEIEGVFPGHGMLDQTNVMLRYELDALNAIMENPDNCDSKKVVNTPHGTMTFCSKNIHQGTAVKYSPDNVYMSQKIKK